MTAAHPGTAPAVAEYVPGAFSAAEWREGFSWPMKLARLWVAVSPRGKGWVPRWIGRHLCAGDRVFTRTLHGAKLAVEPSSLDVFTYIESQGNSWDAHVVDACLALIGTSGVFYDIGASVGYISVEVAASLKGAGAVIAFEPQAALAANIAASARLNEFAHLKVFQAMLGERAGEGFLHVGSHSIHASAIARERGTAKMRCAMTTLDALVMGGAIPPPSMMKVDVEGAELSVFSGARRTIALHRPHLLFESDENMDRYGYRRRDILDLLDSLCAYRYFFVTAAGPRIPLTADTLEDRQHADVLAVPADPPQRPAPGGVHGR